MSMNPMQRVLTALSHREPDRVPFFLLFTVHGAKELGVSIEEYFSRPELVAEAQLLLRQKYGHDCLYGFLYASLETEAWGGQTLFRECAPPNSAAPCIADPETIRSLRPPRVEDSPSLQKALAAQRLMAQHAAGEVPIIGTVMSPFSLPVMQLGFERYLELIYQRPHLFWRLMELNIQFCVSWANAQLEAGATAICYFDPVSSPDITPKAHYATTGGLIAKETLSRIKGPTATHFASGRCLAIIEEVAATGTAAVGVSWADDLSQMKEACRERLTVIGNLNGVAMRTWTAESAAAQVKKAIAAAAKGGGFILSDNHGEIPWQVSDEVLMAIGDTVRSAGRYPLTGDGEC